MNAIYHNFLIKAPLHKVFDAVSKPKQIENWWALRCAGIPELGAQYNLYFGEPYNWYGKVTVFVVNQSFHIKMTKADEDWIPTTFGFDLEEKKEGTYLRFFHKDWLVINDHFKHSSFCWAQLLNGLKNYVEKEEIIPFEHRN
ncbi:conserved protein of unknown function [Tenacibaculum sp. 190130A14a]|uniref:Activator of Hsp90 ATPase homologue 1/2-like C-terminal domain-containing protein n=1 Tax=Tenacibaculum polynesiense TaxID=3137857 RepID=A0ABM9PB65_9FLAO